MPSGKAQLLFFLQLRHTKSKSQPPSEFMLLYTIVPEKIANALKIVPRPTFCKNALLFILF